MRALVANLQRADLTPIEEAHAYAEMQNRFGLTMEKIARQVGVGYHRITNRLLLLALDAEIQALISQGKLSSDAVVARALLDIPDPQARLILARKAAEGGATRKALIAAAKKVAAVAARPEAPKNDAPALTLGLKGAKRALSLPDWNALAQLGRVVPWPIVEESAKATCDSCTLRPMAGADTCGQCPAVQLISLMIDIVEVSKRNREKVYGR